MHGDAFTSCGHVLRAHPHADPAAPVRQHLAQAPTRPSPERADHQLRRAALVTTRRCTHGRRYPPHATKRNPPWSCVVDPHADCHRPQRDRRRRQRLPGRRIRLLRLTAALFPVHRCAMAEARLVPPAQGVPRGIHLRGRTLEERRLCFTHATASVPVIRLDVRDGDPRARASMSRSGRQVPHRRGRLTGQRAGRRGAWHLHDWTD